MAAWFQAVSPDGTIYREYSNAEYTDYRRGLVTRTEIYSADNTSVPKKTTITDWTQDVTGVPYPLNPRPTATPISDSDGNRNRTTVEYTAFGLPSDVYEWGPYGTTEWRTLRRTHTEYNLAEAYVNRRIIGLVAGQYLFAPDAPDSYSIQTLMSKATQEYDIDIGFCDSHSFSSDGIRPGITIPMTRSENHRCAGLRLHFQLQPTPVSHGCHLLSGSQCY